MCNLAHAFKKVLNMGLKLAKEQSLFAYHVTPPNWTLGKSEGPMTGEALLCFPVELLNVA